MGSGKVRTKLPSTLCCVMPSSNRLHLHLHLCFVFPPDLGYAPPQNLTKYALYLDYRIRAYRDLKHDPIRVQSENNRDMRAGDTAEDSRRDSLASSSRKPDPSLVARRQTVVGRKLRVMTVEKGLLRETKVVQKTIDTLLECKVWNAYTGVATPG